MDGLEDAAEEASATSFIQYVTRSDIQSAVEMYNYHGQLGLKRIDLSYCSVVRDEAHPDVWSSNKAFAITANSTREIDSMMSEVAEAFEGLPYRHFVVDPFTPDSFQAYLALNDYSDYALILQMLLNGSVEAEKPAPQASIRPVISIEDWVTLRNLVLVDHAEGARTQAALSEVVTDGIVAGYRAKAGPCQFFLVEVDGQCCAYGSGVNCPNGVGMVEDLFTLPKFRKRGLATQLISHCVKFCRERGADQILIGSHASESPKYLYSKLGFKPSFLTGDMIKQL